jgi:hypothetical protein
LWLVQEVSTKKALHGWLYVAPYQQNTPEARDFKTRVVLATQKMLNTTLPNNTVFDMTSAARLYDSIVLWAKLYSTVQRLRDRTAPSLASIWSLFVGHLCSTAALCLCGAKKAATEV